VDVDALHFYGLPQYFMFMGKSKKLSSLKRFIFLFLSPHKWLGTKKIRDENNFSFIIAIISNMMAGLRHIWTMSNYFCSDENMLVLLSKISNIFTMKVMSIIDLEKIFR
jgi:Dynein heavy chain, N-terminal region 1